MLSEIGYVKPLPSPGKSLLKKKNDPMMNIGVFDFNDMNGEGAEAKVAETSSPQLSESLDSGTTLFVLI